jgi:hypothetical protein
MTETRANTGRVRAHIWYDAAGVILAVGYAPEPADEASRSSRRRAAVLSGEGQYVLEADVPADAIHELHATQQVDVFKRILAPRRPAAD